MALFDGLLIVLRGSNGRRHKKNHKTEEPKHQNRNSSQCVQCQDEKQPPGWNRLRQECPGKTANWLSDSCKLHSSLLQ